MVDVNGFGCPVPTLEVSNGDSVCFVGGPDEAFDLEESNGLTTAFFAAPNGEKD